MSEEYKVIKEFLNEIDFELLVLKIPSNELEDKLAYLAREKGNITRSFYEDFLLATCIANVNQLLQHVKSLMVSPPVLVKIREEIRDFIIKHNELLRPENLYVNRNGVLKLVIREEGHEPYELKSGERRLIDSKNWDTSYYDDLADAYRNTPEDEIGEEKEELDSNIRSIEDLEFTITQQWWKRLSQYVDVKKFDPKDIASIFKERFFHNRSSFQTYIVTICVVDFEDLFSRLDSIGVSSRVAPPILMHELYLLCNTVNPFLTYEKAQELAPEAEDDDEAPDQGAATNVGKFYNRTMAGQLAKKKKKQKLFKDVNKRDLLQLGDNIKVFVIGQDEAVDNLTEAIQRASVGLKDPLKPIGSFLFAGRTGVGKTLATKVLADELIKDRDNLVTIDCSEYSADHEYSKLIGAPAGYVGHEQGGLLTNAIQKNPFSVVVFDEVEKASHKVHELLLQILEEGRLTDGKGKPVPFKDTVVIMTSNIGVKEVDGITNTIGFGDVAEVTDEKKDVAINKALKKKFKPEFLNRIDAIINFKNLSEQDYMKIIDIELYKLNQNLRNNDTEYKELELKFDKTIKDLIFENGIDEQYGARPLKRYIEKEISTPLAKKILVEDITGKNIIMVSSENDEVVYSVAQPVEEPPFYMSDDDLLSMSVGTGD